MSRLVHNALVVMSLGLVLGGMGAWAASGVGLTRHNLSVSGPGPVKSTTVTQVCVFCHTPHKSLGNVEGAPLWNHTLTSGQTYDIYGSSTLDALPGQPTGKSILCLSCHDGTVALGALANPPTGQTIDAILQLPLDSAERGYIGTDLRDDHPISFIYDANLVANDGELIDPSLIGPLVLEADKLECTTCHDPHEKDIQPFLRVTTLNGQICTTCHNKLGWVAGASHRDSTATWNGMGVSPWANRRAEWLSSPDPLVPTVAESGCLNCHAPHNAGTPVRLQKAAEENTCFSCHDGNTASTDIQGDFAKPAAHPVLTTPNPNHDAEALENPLTMSPHAECADCHNPHSVQSDTPMISFNPNAPGVLVNTAPTANALISGVKGVDINGSVVSSVTDQYELCFKCHGLPGKGACGSAIPTERCSTATGWSMTRVDGVYNIRDKVNPATPGLVSWHPLVSNNPANNAEVPSLRTDIPLDRINSLIYCTDCHNSDTSAAAGGTGANGPHGSNNEALLAQTYALDPIVPTGGSTDFVLCFKCHSQAALLTTNLSAFSHDRHINTRTKSCVNCHDPHGSHNSNHLISFQDNSSYTGGPYVISGRGAYPVATFIDNGTYSGTCFLTCHGNGHGGRSY